MNSKYIGTLLDERWEVTRCKTATNHHAYYFLVNIFNGTEMVILDTQLRDVIAGKTTVAHILYTRLKRNDFTKISGRIPK